VASLLIFVFQMELCANPLAGYDGRFKNVCSLSLICATPVLIVSPKMWFLPVKTRSDSEESPQVVESRES
jgi:hypothetical protein